jgi:anti-sigma regulatory factor (Ser/Thr protein kinase)
MSSRQVPAMPEDLVVGVQEHLDYVRLRLRGCLSLRNVPRVREVTVKSLLDSGRVLIDRRPPQVRRHRDLPMHNAAAAAARQFVRESCEIWEVAPEIREIAELLSSELVSNAVEHAHSSSRLTVTGTGPALRVSVRDYSRTLIPRPRPIDIGGLRGRGLHLVAALSQSWGVHQHSDGKTVWINLQHDAPE